MKNRQTFVSLAYFVVFFFFLLQGVFYPRSFPRTPESAVFPDPRKEPGESVL